MDVELAMYVGPHPKNREGDPRTWDAVEIRPLGWKWTKEERQRSVIIKADLTKEEIEQLMQKEVENIYDPENPFDIITAHEVRFRAYQIDDDLLDDNVKFAVKNGGEATPWNERKFDETFLPDGKPLSSPERRLVVRPKRKPAVTSRAGVTAARKLIILRKSFGDEMNRANSSGAKRRIKRKYERAINELRKTMQE